MGKAPRATLAAPLATALQTLTPLCANAKGSGTHAHIGATHTGDERRQPLREERDRVRCAAEQAQHLCKRGVPAERCRVQAVREEHVEQLVQTWPLGTVQLRGAAAAKHEQCLYMIVFQADSLQKKLCDPLHTHTLITFVLQSQAHKLL